MYEKGVNRDKQKNLFLLQREKSLITIFVPNKNVSSILLNENATKNEKEEEETEKCLIHHKNSFYFSSNFILRNNFFIVKMLLKGTIGLLY